MPQIGRRQVFQVAAASAATLAMPPFVFGQNGATGNWPSKPITVVVAYPAGGPTDVLMRAIAPRLSASLGKPVIVDNKPGASESIGAQYVANATPDGHTLLLCTDSPLTMNQFLFRKLAYNPEKDFSPVSYFLHAPQALVVPASLPANTLQEFIALARSRERNPMIYGSAGAGTVMHLSMVSFAKQHNLTMTHVPYKGLAPTLTDLLAERIDAMWGGLASVTPHILEEKLKALVVDAPERVKSLPKVPIFKETGVVRSQANFIFAFVAPAGTPAPIRERLALELRKLLVDAEFKEKYLEPHGYVLVGSTPAELEQFVIKDRVLQAERIKLSGAIAD